MVCRICHVIGFVWSRVDGEDVQQYAPEGVKAMTNILSRIVGVPIELAGDIEIIVDGQRYGAGVER
jgi:hypothetical protein